MSSVIAGGKVMGSGICEADLCDSGLIDLMLAYRRRIAGNYRSLRPHEIGALPSVRMHVSKKIDGELWFLVSLQGQVFLSNSKGKVIAGDIPVLKGAFGLPDGTVIAGELHAIVEGRRARVGDLAAAMAGGPDADVKSILFSGFDLVRDGKANTDTLNYDGRYARLSELIGHGTNAEVVSSEIINTTEQLRGMFEKWVVTGKSEGLIVRMDSGLIYKLKPEITIDAVIIAYTTKADKPNLVRSVLLALMHDDRTYHILGGCGNLGSDEDRKALLSKLSHVKEDAQIRYASDSGSLYTFVSPDIVVSVKLTDLQVDRSDGTISTSMLLARSDAGWTRIGMLACPRPIHPTLERLRPDKAAVAVDVGFSQVADCLSAPLKAKETRTVLPVSKLLRRQVWTREAKGQTAVRKLLVWKTNKDAEDSNFPAYVVHWTDYSSLRASPLDREVRLAKTEEEATKIADSMLEENIKKGWVAL